MENDPTENSESKKLASQNRAFQVSSEPLIANDPSRDSQAANHDLGTLPSSYGSDTLFLVARDPRQLFCYWDVDFSKLNANDFDEGKWQIALRLSANGEVVSTTIANVDLRHSYLPAERGAATYSVELGYFDRAKNWVSLIRSNDAQTPASGIADSSERADFATIPMHLDFQRLTEIVEENVREHLPLGAALARLQNEEMRLASQPVWNEEERALVARLLGVDNAHLATLAPAEIDRWLRGELERRLYSDRSSGEFSGGNWSPLASSLFSGFGAFQSLRSGSLSSFGLSSGALAQFGLSSSALAQLGFSSETLSSFGLSTASLTSPFGASWSSGAGRDFFMHVNAEVIFYGGTKPGSRVTIDGKEIPLTANGTFSFHFKFPDGDFEMPIVATSPDGVETRSATLSFRRNTERVGKVDHTGQSAHLADPRI